jgi:hypothetical protein
MKKTLLLGFTLAVATVGAFALAVPARADEFDYRLHRMRELCDAGDRHACHEFHEMIELRRDRHEEWRREHPEFFRY